VARVARVNAQVDINIVVATGLYALSDVPYLFQYHGPGTLLGGEEPMVGMFVKDLTEGIAGTGIRAAFLKCAIEESLTPGVERVLRAVAKAHLITGAPIMVHTSAVHRTGLVAQDMACAPTPPTCGWPWRSPGATSRRRTGTRASSRGPARCRTSCRTRSG
jgi:phosphotriesterase-related protein